MKTHEDLTALANLIRTEDCSNGMDNKASKLIREWAAESFKDTHIQLISLYDTNKKDPTFVGGFLFAISQAFGGKYSLCLYQKAIIDGLSNKGFKETFTQEMAIMAIEYDRSQWAYDVLKKYGTEVAESLIEYRDKVMAELEDELKSRNNNDAKINEGNSESYIRVYSIIRDAILTHQTELTYENDGICRSLASIFENEEVSECQVTYRENKTFCIYLYYVDGLCFTIMINDKNLNHLYFYISKHGIDLGNIEYGIIGLKECIEKRQRFKENIKKIRHTLESELVRKGQPLDADLDVICEAYVNAFYEQTIIDLNADYGTKYGGLTLDIVINDGLEFIVRTEKSEPEMGFSILRDNVLIYANCSYLWNFVKEVNEFFKRRKDAESNYEHLKQLINDEKDI